MDVADPGCRAARESNRIFADRKRIARVEDDADVVAERFTELEQFLAAEVLVILDREDQPRVGNLRRLPEQRRAGMRDHVVPARSQRRPASLEHRGQMKSDDRCANGPGAPDRVLQRLTRFVGEPEAGNACDAAKPVASLGEVPIRQAGQPPVIELDAPDTGLLREGDESRHADRRRIRAGSAGALEADGIREAVGVEAY
jgi:hypothetical protein